MLELKTFISENHLHSRFDTSNVGDTVRLVPDWSGDLTDTVEPMDTGHPLIWSKLDLTYKVVEVSEERGEDLLGTRRGLVTSRGDDILGEVGVVL